MTKSAGKAVSSLRVEDLKKHPVWQFVASDDCELCVTPVRRLPASGLRGKLLATRVSLADGTWCWALFGNLNGKDPRLSEIFLTDSIWNGNRWFYLAGYFDSDYAVLAPSPGS